MISPDSHYGRIARFFPYRSWLTALLAFLLSMTLYLLTLSPTVTGEDSGELIAAAYGQGVAHPPGYPLWTLLATGIIKIIPFGSVAWRVNLLSALLAALTAGIFCWILQKFLQVSALVAVMGSLILALGRDLWSQSVITEVYTLHILLFCLILYAMLAWRQNPQPKYLYGIALLMGLALANHHLAILLGPVLILWVLGIQPRTFLQIRIVLLCLIFLVIGLLPYLYLPLAAQGHPYLNWGQPDTWENFIRHVLRQQYGDEAMHQAHSFFRLGKHLLILGQWNLQQYTPYSLPLMLVGLIYLFRKFRIYFYLTLGLFLLHTVILAEILNFGFQRQDMFCNQVFFLPAYILTALWLTVGLELLVRTIQNRKIPVGFLGQGVTVILTLIVILSNYSLNNKRNYYYAYDHARNILNSLEPNALLIPSGDHNTFPTIYLHYVEKVRPDITIADKYGYIEYALYQDMPQAPKRIHSRQEREQIEAWLIQHSGKPVYYTVKPSLELLPGYQAVSYGLLFRIYGPQEKLSSAPLPQYSYRNLSDHPDHQDHAAQVILSDYYFYLAANDLRKGNIESALASIERAEQLSKGLKEEMNNLATLLAEFGQDQLAIYYYEQAAKLDPKYLTPRWNLAYLFKAQGDLVHAIQVFNDLAQIEPEDYRIFGELGFLLAQHGTIDLAIQNWGKSLALNPDQPQILQALSRLSPPSKP